jgi:2-oxoglutarate ferredoxin oxidoreductase subunit alpha
MFKRYEVTEDGISPRVIPGQKHGIHHVTGVEHNEMGRPTEDPIIRVKQMNKRLSKLKNLKFPNPILANTKYDDADALIVGMGSTRGAIEEAIERLEADGFKVNQAHVRLIHPFPVEEMKALMDKAKKVIVVEHNATGQLADQIKLRVGMAEKISNVLKYDGNPFLPSEVYNRVKELL